MKTTTFPGRHTGTIRRTAAAIEAPAPRVLEIGPGLALRPFGSLMRRGSWTRPVAKWAESALRRLPWPDRWYENYETSDIIEAFAPRPVRLTLLDINPRPLSVVPANFPGVAITAVQADLGSPRLLADHPELRGAFDLVVCMCTIGRLPHAARPMGLANVIAMVRPGGMLISDGPRDPESVGLAETAANVYRRTAGSDRETAPLPDAPMSGAFGTP